ncbi:MAG: PTS sugar transporter subunit IIA [Kiritimatiellae bacterium]|nr:PTS sugar transporter subunit IIA [Kiritimatiellia bacterium]
MQHEMLVLDEAARHAHIEPNELRHVAQRGEIDSVNHGDNWFFSHRAVDEWAQRRLLSLNAKNLKRAHDSMVESRRRKRSADLRVSSLVSEATVDLALAAKAKAGIIRDMTDLADRSGKLYDPDTLFKELLAREDASPTAIGRGVAFLHPRFHDPYIFAESFVAYARSERPIFFGAPDASATRHFFLVCSTDHEDHLHILARLAVLVHGTDLIGMLEDAPDVPAALAAIRKCEEEFVR